MWRLNINKAGAMGRQKGDALSSQTDDSYRDNKSMLVVAVEGDNERLLGPGLLADGKALKADLEKSDRGLFGLFNKTRYLSDGDMLDFRAIDDLNKLPDLAKQYERVFIVAHGTTEGPQQSQMFYNGTAKMDIQLGWSRTLSRELSIDNVSNIYGCNSADGKLRVGAYDFSPPNSIVRQIKPLIETYFGD
jgi:hypothetical protein